MRTVLVLLLLVAAWFAQPTHAQQNATVLCSSQNNGYAECRKPYRGPAQLTQKYSAAGCAPGQGWGQTDDIVWVDRGCRALFEMSYPPAAGRPPSNRPPDYGSSRPPDHGSGRPPQQGRPPDYGSGRPPQQGRPPDHGNNRPPDYGKPGHVDEPIRELKCESWKDRYQSCEWLRAWGRPQLSRQLSQTRCVEGQNWGYSRRDNQIWVDRGCRAEFRSR